MKIFLIIVWVMYVGVCFYPNWDIGDRIACIVIAIPVTLLMLLFLFGRKITRK